MSKMLSLLRYNSNKNGPLRRPAYQQDTILGVVRKLIRKHTVIQGHNYQWNNGKSTWITAFDISVASAPFVLKNVIILAFE